MSTIQRLQFVPLRDLAKAELGADIEKRLRNRDLNPPGAVYVDLGDGQEAVALLGESYQVPAAYLAIESQDFSDSGGEPGDPFHVRPTANDTRCLTMESDELRHLQEKLAFYWTHSKLPEIETASASGDAKESASK